MSVAAKAIVVKLVENRRVAAAAAEAERLIARARRASQA
jgi:hypothetical protein